MQKVWIQSQTTFASVAKNEDGHFCCKVGFSIGASATLLLTSAARFCMQTWLCSPASRHSVCGSWLCGSVTCSSCQACSMGTPRHLLHPCASVCRC